MSYCNKFNLRHAKAEAILPIRNGAFFLFFGIISLLFSANVLASNFQKEIKRYINNEITHYLGSINKQSQQKKIALYIPAAAKELSCEQLSINRVKPNSIPAGRIRLTLSCADPIWQFRATAKVDLWLNLVVAKRDLQRGEVLSNELLNYDSINIAKHVYGMETSTNELIGMTVKRNIKQGDLVTRRQLENNYLVNKEQHIKLLISTSSFTASVKAIALEEGIKGQMIKVKNLSSGKIVEGQVIDKGVVKATLL